MNKEDLKTMADLELGKKKYTIKEIKENKIAVFCKNDFEIKRLNPDNKTGLEAFCGMVWEYGVWDLKEEIFYFFTKERAKYYTIINFEDIDFEEEKSDRAKMVLWEDDNTTMAKNASVEEQILNNKVNDYTPFDGVATNGDVNKNQTKEKLQEKNRQTTEDLEHQNEIVAIIGKK